MMADSKIYALIQSISTEVSAQYESIGIQSQIFVEPNIFRNTLKDGTVIDIPIENFRNYSIQDQANVKKLITNGLGDLWLDNSGKYSKPTLNNVLNYNKPIIINSTDWRQDGGLDRYTVTINHNLNTENIVPALWNSLNKLETVGIERLNDKQVRLESTEPLTGILVLNYSTTDASESLNNIATIKTEYSFDTMTDLNTYFTNTPNTLENRLIVGVGTNPVKILMWTGVTSPSIYDESTDINLWSDQTALIRGATGIQGVQGERGYSDYELAKQNGFVGSLDEWLESLNSCLGKFDNLAQLLTKYPLASVGNYPNGVDSHKFALVIDITGTGLVSMAFYSSTDAEWQLTKLNQAIAVGKPKNLCRL